jgi:hypothetical protein
MLRSAYQARLEARTAALQPFAPILSQALRSIPPISAPNEPAIGRISRELGIIAIGLRTIER